MKNASASSREPLSLTAQQASALKHQPDTGQGLRDQLILCFLFNEKLPVKTISQLRVSSFVREAKVVVLPPNGEEELPLTEETFRTLDRYVTSTMPSVFLIQASVSNGELDGGGIGVPAIYARVEALGSALKLPERLTVDACYHYQDALTTTPKPRRRIVAQATSPTPIPPAGSAHLPEITGLLPTLASPLGSLDTLMSSLAALEGCMEAIFSIQRGGNITPHLEHLCTQADGLCAELDSELTALRQVVNILPLHFTLLRLFPQREERMSEPFLLKLEVCITTSLTQAFAASLNRVAAEEQAYFACQRVVVMELGENQMEKLDDLVKGIVVYASMFIQRHRDRLDEAPRETQPKNAQQGRETHSQERR